MKHLRLNNNNNNNKAGKFQVVASAISLDEDRIWACFGLAEGCIFSSQQCDCEECRPYDSGSEPNDFGSEPDDFGSEPDDSGSEPVSLHRQADLAVETHNRAQAELRHAITVGLATFQVAALHCIAEQAAAEKAVALAAADEASLLAYADEMVVWRDTAKNPHEVSFARRALRHTMGAAAKAAAAKAAAFRTLEELSWPQLPVL